MINILNWAQSLAGNDIEIQSVNFFKSFVCIDFKIDNANNIFTSDGCTVEEAIQSALTNRMLFLNIINKLTD